MSLRRFLVGWMSVVSCVLFASVAGAEEPADDLQLIFWKGNQLSRIALRLDVDGQSAAHVWEQKFAALAAYYDRDGGGLNEAEAQRLPSVAAMREVITLGFVPQLGAAPAWKELDADGNGTASPEEISRHYRSQGIGTIPIAAGVMPYSAELTTSLLQLLDTNGDQKVDIAEWQAAPTMLSKLDRNDDELVGAGELVARILYPGISGGTLLLPPRPPAADPRPAALTFPVMLLPADSADCYWSQLLVTARDKDGDHKLAESEAGLAHETFLALDKDNDSALNADELAGWRTMEPEYRQTIQLAADGSAAPHLLAAESSTQTAGQWELNANGNHLLLRTDEGRLSGATANVREYFSELFTTADMDADGKVTTAELDEKQSADWRWLVPIADRDANGEVTRMELENWLGLQTELARGDMMLSILDGGKGVFELLDSNHDGALSLPEFRSAAKEIESAGCLVEGVLQTDKLPHTILMTVSQGYPQSPLGKRQRTGPAWFLAMDRNGDGAVSAREFTGPVDVFGILDLDKDEFLSTQEAAQAGN